MPRVGDIIATSLTIRNDHLDTISDVAAATAATLTDNSTGTASQTVVTSAGANPTQAEFNNNMATLTDEINKLVADNAAIRTELNDTITVLRNNGLIN